MQIGAIFCAVIVPLLGALGGAVGLKITAAFAGALIGGLIGMVIGACCACVVMTEGGGLNPWDIFIMAMNVAGSTDDFKFNLRILVLLCGSIGVVIGAFCTGKLVEMGWVTLVLGTLSGLLLGGLGGAVVGRVLGEVVQADEAFAHSQRRRGR